MASNETPEMALSLREGRRVAYAKCGTEVHVYDLESDGDVQMDVED
jgi:hypothetical protein